MVFNSLIYLLFLSLSAILFYILPGRFRWVLLLSASVLFYLSFIPVFLSLLIVIIVCNYYLARRLARVPDTRKRRELIVIVVINLLILAVFKYFNLIFPGNQIHLYNVDWFYRTSPIEKMILPLGLSYFIFTVLSYQIEIKRKTIQPENHFGYYSLYLLFFPKISQGPIERPQSLIPQLKLQQSFNYDMVVEGLKLILLGYFKKLVVADRLAIYVNAVYDNSEYHNGTSLLIATIFFAFQIYADFSGYTDIALGSARLFGIKLTNNFNRPYFATSIKEFWNRWHITFSNWLRDYIFLPIAFYLSNKLKKEKYFLITTEKWIYLIASMITFTICGIWHGEAWTYLVWGVLFGVYLTYANWTEKLSKNFRKRYKIRKSSKGYIAYNIVITFILVSIAWIFFRASSLADAGIIIKKILTSFSKPFYESPANILFALFGILTLIAMDFNTEFFESRFSLLNNRYYLVRIATIVAMIVTILLIGVFDGGQFIYFQY
jgi:alginate O-acetyltransferase complex protein AlgI